MELFRKPCTELFSIFLDEQSGKEFVKPLENVRFWNNGVKMHKGKPFPLEDYTYFGVTGLSPMDIKNKFWGNELVVHKDNDWYIIDGIGI